MTRTRLNKIGSNQYQLKQERILGLKHKTLWNVTVAIYFMLAVSYIGSNFKALEPVNLISPIPERAYAMEDTVAPVVEATEQDQTRSDIERYMRVIFGKEFRVARAVQYNECNPANRQYPKCVLHTPHEYSVGIFQINLKSESTKVHWDKIPGATLEEKAEWLKDPFNNILIAKSIWGDSGWTPWSAYTSGNYKKDL